MNLTDYNTLRYGLQCNAMPADDGSLRRLGHVLERRLAEVGVFLDVEIEHTNDVDNLLIGMARFSCDLTAAEVAALLEEVWSSRVGHAYWSMQVLTTRPGHVELHAASRESDRGQYVTLHLVALATEIPAQRLAPEDRPLTTIPRPRQAPADHTVRPRRNH